MTQDQLQKLKSMTVWEITRKYLPMKLSGRINQDQYDYILRQAKDFTRGRNLPNDRRRAAGASESTGSEGSTTGSDLADSGYSSRHGNAGGDDAVARLCKEFNGIEVTQHHPDTVVGTSQKARLLRYLLKKGQATTPEIMQDVYHIDPDKGGTCRIASRINELRNDGWHIPKAKKVRKGVYLYKILGKKNSQ